MSPEQRKELDLIIKDHKQSHPTFANPAWLYEHQHLGFVLKLIEDGELIDKPINLTPGVWVAQNVGAADQSQGELQQC